MYHSKWNFIIYYNFAYFSKENYLTSKKFCSYYKSCCQQYKNVYASN
jgi:hypothetical protein